MRDRGRIVGNLESLYKGAFSQAESDGDQAEMARLDFAFQRDQLQLEVLLDIRELLTPEPQSTAESATEKAKGLFEKAQAIKKMTRLR